MLTPPPPAAAARIHDFLTDSGYTTAGLAKILVHPENPVRQRRNLALLLGKTREPTRLHILIRWFALGEPVDRQDVGAAIPPEFLALAVEHGLLAARASMVAAPVMLAPFDGFFVASDHAQTVTTPDDPDLVGHLTPATWTLHRFALYRAAGSALQLDSGCGALALAASAHCETAVAAGEGARATNFAAFNAALNQRPNVECLTGAGLTSLSGRRFGLVLSRPRFGFTPAGGEELDGRTRAIILQAPELLNEGGCLQISGEWIQTKDEDWRERLAGWFEGLGCDAWVAKTNTQSPERFASDRVIDSTPPDPKADALGYESLIHRFREHKLRSIHRGLIALRRRSGRNWTRFTQLPRLPGKSFGAIVAGHFAAEDFLSSHPTDESLLARRLRLSPDLRMMTRTVPSERAWRTEVMRIHLDSGIPFSRQVDHLTAELLSQFDPPCSLAAAIETLSGRTSAKPEHVRRECITAARKLLNRRFLLPEDPPRC